MSEAHKDEFDAVLEQLDNARRATVPDLAEVRRCREMFYAFLIDRSIELLEAERNEAALQARVGVRFDVRSNDSPTLSAPRGLCSPVKSGEIRQFENLVRKVFGNSAERCTTAWKQFSGSE